MVDARPYLLARLMFPHQKLDWTTSRLERHLESHPDDVATRVEFAAAVLSRAWFHDGGELWFNKALTQARRVLHHDPGNPRAQTIAGAALVGLDRLEPASRYLDQALRQDPERADVHLAVGAMHLAGGEKHQAVREFEFSCRQAPESWEPHALLGLLLRQRAIELGQPLRVLERSQFHIVQAIKLGPSPTWGPRLQFELAMSCLQTGKLADAHKLFTRLAESREHRAKARFHLGIVALHMGKYKNAVLYLRQHLQEHGDNHHVHARIATCYLELGEHVKAREACNRALALQPDDVQARWTLGCALLEEDRVEDATRLFKEILRDAPQHTPAFAELVRIRRDARDDHWIGQALRAEVSLYDRLPMVAHDQSGQVVQPRKSTHARVKLLIEALYEASEDGVQRLLECLALTTDEGMRFELWEAALLQIGRRHSRAAIAWTQNPGRYFSTDRGHELLALATVLPENSLSRALQLGEEDLQRAAVDRHGPANDVVTHRRRVESEREQARTWQALVLLAIADQGTQTGRNLLVRWATEADEELANVARIGLASMGDEHARAHLDLKARHTAASGPLQTLYRKAASTESITRARPMSDDEDRTCATCGRRTAEVDHMMVGGSTAVCDRCMTTIARKRHELSTDDPRVICALSGKTTVDSREIYIYNGIAVAAEMVDQSLGLLEREEVDRFLATR
ncbi:MAG: tetratricopeptide (TPR) repeat protein [Kiritimatiellia bacterium]|jgi:tetratricopeptide (TPR) repeat protein